jgi:hypothetical protein
MIEILNWLQSWYQSQCDGDWEHSYGIKIDTVDNPGWFITIDLDETKWSDLEIESELIEKNKDDWFFYKIKESKFKASGDPSKLDLLLKTFKEIIEEHTN